MKNVNKKLLLCTVLSIVSSISHSSEFITSWWKPKSQPQAEMPKPIHKPLTAAQIEAIRPKAIYEYPSLLLAAMPSYTTKQAQIDAQVSAKKAYKTFEASTIILAQGTQSLALQTAAKAKTKAHEIAEDAYQRTTTRIQDAVESSKARIRKTAYDFIDDTNDAIKSKAQVAYQKASTRIQETKFGIIDAAQSRIDSITDAFESSKTRAIKTAQDAIDETNDAIKSKLEASTSWIIKLPRRAADKATDNIEEAAYHLKRKAKKTADQATQSISDAIRAWRLK